VIGASHTNGSPGALPNSGALHRHQQETAQIPDYNSGAPGLALLVRVPLVDEAPSFNDAIDRAAFILANDGWSIESVSHCAMLGRDDQGYAIFQIAVTATRT
jgi:hypothetical protein